MNENAQALPSSYRDPAGFVFRKGNTLFRKVLPAGMADYTLLMQSGLYHRLTEKKLLVTHTETGEEHETGGIILQPFPIPFISYPWEWSFPQLQEAALNTLDITREALKHGMILKDATPFNIQWLGGRMSLIDTLSFTTYREGSPWIAYRQFCESFLSPLLLMHYTGQPLSSLQLAWPEGIPLAITRSLLPYRSRFSVLTYLHIHLHARMSLRLNEKVESAKSLPKQRLLRLLDSLQSLTASLQAPLPKSTWGNYYAEAGQRDGYLEQKKQVIRNWINGQDRIQTAVDFGANEGTFSLPLAEKGIHTVAADGDAVAITKLYRFIRQKEQENIIPLVMDFTWPSPGMGLENTERASFFERLGGRDMGLCLALIHHLCIGKNIPFEKLASILAASAKKLIIEFVPKEDEKVQLLLRNREDIFPSYTRENFETTFKHHYTIEQIHELKGTARVLYLMYRK